MQKEAVTDAKQRPGFPKDLRERTKAFALRVVRMFSALPKTTEAQVLGKQLLRSGTSVGANYREAFRARSKAEFTAKRGDSLREVEEWSALGNRDIDGQTGEVAGELLGKQLVKAPTGHGELTRQRHQSSSILSSENLFWMTDALMNHDPRNCNAKTANGIENF